MSHYYVEVSDIVGAPPEKVYAIISDYHAGHPSILPSRYFTKLTVQEGGKGEGTQDIPRGATPARRSSAKRRRVMN